MPLKSLSLCVSLLACAFPAGAQTCGSSVPNPVSAQLGAQLSAAAINEYAEFNGHRINADGYLWKAGSTESESELLRDPESGEADRHRPGRFAWRRVWEYWLALDRHVEGEALSRKVISVPGLLEDPAASGRPSETRLSVLLPQADGEDPAIRAALREAAVRAALNDSPWSAAFISYLMDRVHLTDRQFRYASAHWQYIQRAFEQPEGYAFKACDPRRTPARVGDLLCHARGDSPLKTFEDWHDAVAGPGFSAASHCEVVVSVDHDAKKMETIGGNVLQSVVLRKLKLNEQNLLSDSYRPDRRGARPGKECARDKTCDKDNLNQQYWGVLLRLQ